MLLFFIPLQLLREFAYNCYPRNFRGNPFYLYHHYISDTMKNYFIVLAAVIITGMSVNCQGIKVPEVVKNSFATKYPGAKEVKWGKEKAKEFEAEFKLNKTSAFANFGLDGSWVETETRIAVADLPAAVSTAIKTKYPGSPITLAEKTEQPGNKVLYEVVIKVNGKKKAVELNPDGSFVK